LCHVVSRCTAHVLRRPRVPPAATESISISRAGTEGDSLQ
jgi:hypothetical protein